MGIISFHGNKQEMFVCVIHWKLVVKQIMIFVDDNATLIMYINIVSIPNITWVPSLACANKWAMEDGRRMQSFQQSHRMTVWCSICNEFHCHTDPFFLWTLHYVWSCSIRQCSTTVHSTIVTHTMSIPFHTSELPVVVTIIWIAYATMSWGTSTDGQDVRKWLLCSCHWNFGAHGEGAPGGRSTDYFEVAHL